MRISGLISSIASRISERRVSERMYRSSGSVPIRCARIFSCFSLSSPDTYKTLEKIAIEEDEDPWDEVEDDEVSEEVMDEIDKNVDENYL